MIYECTDCQNCASFDDGWRVYCLAGGLPTERVFEYYPLGVRDAKYCSGFKEGTPDVELTIGWHDKMLEDLKYTGEEDIPTLYKAIRAWCIAHKKNY